MCFFVAILFFLLSFVSYKLSHSCLHPSFITCCLWGSVLLIYQLTDHGLYPLSEKFYYALLLWVIPFCFTSLLSSRFRIRLSPCISGKHNRLLFFIYPFIGICLIISIYGLYQKGLYYNSENIFSGIRAAGVASLNGEEEEFHYPLYIKVAMFFADMALIIALSIFSEKKKKVPFAIFIILLFIFYIFRSNKTVIAQLMCSFFVIGIISRSYPKKKILIFVITGIFLMLLTHLLRSKDADSFSLIHFISVYFLAPLPGFDSILNSHYNFINSFHGEYTFRFFVPYLQMLGFQVEGNPDPFNLHNWAYTPLPVNVYTSMFSFYIDFGYWGILFFSIICGLFWGILYKLAKLQYPIGKVLYSIFFYILIFQFFCDYLFQFLGANIMIFIMTLIFYTQIKIKIKNGNDNSIDNYCKL